MTMFQDTDSDVPSSPDRGSISHASVFDTPRTSTMAESEFQERMDIYYGDRFDPVLDNKKWTCHCNFCDSFYPRTTPVRQRCLNCLKERMAEKLKPLHVKVPPQDVRERIMAFILPVAERKRDQKKFFLRTILIHPSRSKLMLLESNERSRLSGEKEEFVYHFPTLEDYWGPACLLDYMLRFV